MHDRPTFEERASAAVHLSGLAYRLPAATLDLDALKAAKLVRSPLRVLDLLGWRQVHVAEGDEMHDLALAATREALAQAGVPSDRVGMLVYGGTFPPGDVRRGGRRPADPLALFRFPACRLQDELALAGASVVALDQQSCVAGLAALRLARAHLLAEPELGHVLCVLVDQLPAGYRREILGNVIGDGVAAAVVSLGAGPLRLGSATVRTHGALRDPAAETDALLAAYVAGARQVVERALCAAAVAPEAVRLIVPHNINRPAWEVLRGMLPLAGADLYDVTRAAHGHVPAADPLINLAHARAAGALPAHEPVLLYNSGFGLHWAAAVVRP